MPGFNAFGHAVANKRGNRTYREVAPEIGIDHSIVARIEHGHWPCIRTLVKLCDWLGIDAGDGIRLLNTEEVPA